MVTPMKTTVEIADDLLRAAKERARRDGTTLRALLEEGLREALRRRGRSRGPFRLKMVTFKGKGLRPGLRPGDWEKLRALMYEDHGG